MENSKLKRNKANVKNVIVKKVSSVTNQIIAIERWDETAQHVHLGQKCWRTLSRRWFL